MKVQIEKPNGNVIMVEGRMKAVASLLNAWWEGTQDDVVVVKRHKIARSVGFQPNNEEEETSEYSDPA